MMFEYAKKKTESIQFFLYLEWVGGMVCLSTNLCCEKNISFIFFGYGSVFGRMSKLLR